MATETTNDTSATNSTPNDHEIEALFVQTADSMAYADGVLTLKGMAPTTLLFSDRPDRVTGRHFTSVFSTGGYAM